ncbi:MAG: hypothetical protein GXY76_22510 [Chloroflexi bacterium]|nr:hypothetical protein [Chloroflexota bacterium]
MSNPVLELGTCFDWASPLVASARDLANGSNHTFLVPEDCGWAARDIRRLLRRHGVRVWGLMIVDRTILLTVRRAQARWAEYLLLRHGLPLLSGYAARPGQQPRLRRAPSGQPSLLSRFERWIYRLQNQLDL